MGSEDTFGEVRIVERLKCHWLRSASEGVSFARSTLAERKYPVDIEQFGPIQNAMMASYPFFLAWEALVCLVYFFPTQYASHT